MRRPASGFTLVMHGWRLSKGVQGLVTGKTRGRGSLLCMCAGRGESEGGAQGEGRVAAAGRWGRERDDEGGYG